MAGDRAKAACAHRNESGMRIKRFMANPPSPCRVASCRRWIAGYQTGGRQSASTPAIFATAQRVACQSKARLWSKPALLAPSTSVRMSLRSRHNRCVPPHPSRATSGCEQSQQGSRLFDHLVGTGEQVRRHVEAEQSRRLQVDDELKFG